MGQWKSSLNKAEPNAVEIQQNSQQQQLLLDPGTLLSYCCKGDIDTVKEMIRKGVSPHGAMVTYSSSRVLYHSHPLIGAIQSGNIILVHYLVEEANVDIFDTKVRQLQ